MGPAPEAGGLLQVEPSEGKVWIYNPETKSVQELPMQMDAVTEVGPKDARLKGKSFPIIDKEQGTITVYVPRLESLVTFKPTPEELALPDYVWRLGDEVRIAFRNENKAQSIRVMNVSKTSIFTR